MREVDYLWEHWKFNADQRIKAFNFFVVFSVFANGGVFTAVEKCVHPAVTLVIGGFIIALAIAFFLMDLRSAGLVTLAEPGLKEFENTLGASARLFHHDAAKRHRFVRFKYAFRSLFVLQFVFGLLVVGFSVVGLAPGIVCLSSAPSLGKCG